MAPVKGRAYSSEKRTRTLLRTYLYIDSLLLMEQKLRMTRALEDVLRALVAEPTKDFYGLQLCQAANLPSGTIYPILARLEQSGWVTSDWEDPDISITEGRPRRRFYRLSEDGAVAARTALARRDRPRSALRTHAAGEAS
jgi:PadR family transcriptional regulator PadR